MSAATEPVCDSDDGSGSESGSYSADRLGDPDSWVTEYGDILLRYAVLRVGDVATAEDLVQETLLAAWRGRSGFSGDCAPRTWLVAILKRRIADHYRQHGRRAALEERAAEHATETARDSCSAEDAEFWSVFSNCTGDLPDHLARAFNLRAFADEKPEAICDSEGITRKNLSVRLHRARQLLRRCLESRWFGGGDGERR